MKIPLEKAPMMFLLCNYGSPRKRCYTDALALKWSHMGNPGAVMRWIYRARSVLHSLRERTAAAGGPHLSPGPTR